MKKETKRVGITDTTLRDAHQSLLATRMSIDDILAVASDLDKVGFASLECWGGATFDSCMRFLNEDPWGRLRRIRKAAPNTKLQMLIRGQNLLGYRNYPDDVLELFVKKSVENGIDIIRVFDALNDPRNVAKCMEYIKQAGAHAQAAIAYTTSPVHNVEYFTKVSKQMRDMGADSICIKDMSGILHPYVAYELVKSIKEATGLPVQLHSHYSTGLAGMAYMKGVEAGADVIDCAMSPFSLSSSQPAVESMIAAFQGTPYDTGLDLKQLEPIAAKLKEIRTHYKEFDITNSQVEAGILTSQIPGGMISNFMSQLRGMNALDKLDEVLAEVPRVRKDLGYPPLVTPTSQMVGSQAALNVLAGERYKQTSKEVKDYLKGLFGQTPAPVDPDVLKKVIGDEKPIQCRPADLLAPRLEEARAEIGYLAKSDEDVLSYCCFPDVARKFFESREEAIVRFDLNLMQNGSGYSQV